MVDIGFSFHALLKFLSHLGKDISHISALFITHEHEDHIRGLKSFVKQTDIPIYISEKSRHFLEFHIENYQELLSQKAIALNNMEITPFSVSHDAANTFGFIIRENNTSLFLASDIGSFDETTVGLARDCEAIAIESNHDLDMLSRSFYPDHLKKRILSDYGHLSNEDAVDFIEKSVSGRTRNVFFLHLSENNNSRDIVSGLISRRLTSKYPYVQFHISNRDKPSDLIEL